METMQLLFNIDVAMNAGFAGKVQQAGKVFQDLQNKTQALQKVSGDITSYQRQQTSITDLAGKLSGLRQEQITAQQTLSEARTRLQGLNDQYKAGQSRMTELRSVQNETNQEYMKQSERVRELSNVYMQNSTTLKSEYEEARRKLEELSRTQPNSTAYQEQARKVKDLRSEYQETTRTQQVSLNAEQAKLKGLGVSLKQASSAYREQQKRVKELAGAYKAGENEVKKYEAGEKQLSESIKKTDELLSSEREKLRLMGTALREAGVNTDNLAQKQAELAGAITRSEEAQAKYNGIREKLTWQNMKGDIMTAAASMSALKVPVQVDMEFEQAMQNVRAVMGANDEDFAMLRTQSMELGSTTQFSASQAAATQENLARAGFSRDEIISTMKPLLDMAAAEGMDLAQAGSGLSTIMRSMNMEATDAQRIADTLAYTSAASNTGIAELVEGFKIMGPTAAGLGMSIEQLGAMMGAMADKGKTGSEAGTSLSSSIAGLAKPSKDTMKALAELKVRIRTKKGEMVELPEILKQIDTATKNMGAFKKEGYLARIFGKTNIAAMTGLMDASAAGRVDTLQTQLVNDKTGKAGEMAAVRNDTLKGDITALGSAWEGLMINIGSALEPINRFVTQTLTEGITKVNAFMTEHQTLAGWVVKIAGGFMAWKTISTVYSYGSLLVQLPFAKIAASLAAGNAQAVLTGEKFSLIGSIASKAWSVIAAHPFVAVGAAVVTAAALIYENWDRIKEVAGASADWVKDKWSAFSDWLSTLQFPDIFAPIVEFASSTIEYVKNLFSGLGDWIMNTIGKLNPFNWEMPSWLGGGQANAEKRAQSQQKLASWDPLSGNLPGYATGGLITSHSIIQVGEKGPEMIIPLRDKRRGLSLLSEAGRELGVAGHATGGIFTSAHLGQVAESGPEAIIPLRDKRRGGMLLNRVAGMLGLGGVVEGTLRKNEVQERYYAAGVLNGGLTEREARMRAISNTLDFDTRGNEVRSYVSMLTGGVNIQGDNEVLGRVIGGLIMRKTNAPVSSAFTSNSPVSAFTSNAPVSAFTSNSPVSAFTNNAPVSAFTNNSPVSAFTSNSPVSAFTNNSPVSAFTNNAPVSAFTNAPVSAFTSNAPVSAFMSNAPVSAFTNNSPVSAFTSNAPELPMIKPREYGGVGVEGATSDRLPPVNITVNAGGAERDNEGLAELIARKVREVLSEMMNYGERVSYE